MAGTATSGIELLDPRNRRDVEAIAALHEEYLSTSPVVQMGRLFMRRFYYTRLVQEGLVDVILCRVEGQIAGFISFTRYPHDFMSRGLRKGFVQLAWIMGTSVLRRPAILKDILLVLRVMRERAEHSERSEQGKQAPQRVREGEVLSIVSATEYRNHVPEGGKSRLTIRLFEEMEQWFREQEFDRVYLLVEPKNLASNLFCSSIGCEFERVEHGGVATHKYTYHLRDDDVQAAAAGGAG